MENNVSFGSGSNLLGAPASVLLGMPGGTQQQSPSSAGFDPGILPPPPGQAPQGPTMPSMAPSPIQGSQPLPPQMPMGQPAPTPQGVVGLPPGNPEAISIIKALTSRLASINKAEELQRGGLIG